MLALSALHLVFPRRFQWKQDLAKLQDINRQIFLVHCFFICLVLVLMGLLCAFYGEVFLGGGELRKIVAAGCALFWGFRLLVQHFVYDSSLWKGKPLETFVHVVFTVLWTYFTCLFLWVMVTA